MRVLCSAGLGVTGYLAVKALRAEDVAGCGGGALWDCGFALHSRWSKVFSLPVSVPAFGLYAVLLVLLSVCRPSASRSRVRLALGAVTVGAVLAGLAAVWFIGLQILAVGHLCVYCLAAHLCGLALCLAILWKRPLGARTTVLLSGFSVAAVSTLIGAQVFSAPPPTFKIDRHPAAVIAAHETAPTGSDARSKPSEKPRASEVFEPPAGIPDDAEK